LRNDGLSIGDLPSNSGYYYVLASVFQVSGERTRFNLRILFIEGDSG